MTSLLSGWTRSALRSRHPSRSAVTVPYRTRLSVTSLEDRCVPATGPIVSDPDPVPTVPGSPPPPPPLPAVTVVRVTDGAEVGGNGLFRLSRTGATTASLAARYTVQTVGPGLASPGADYQALPGTVTFSAGKATVDVPVVVKNDIASEPTETVAVSVAAGTGYTAVSGTAVVAILDNDTVVGQPGVAGVDLDADGVADGAEVDRNGDGIADGVDVDGDGIADGFGVDLDGDGIADGVVLNGAPNDWDGDGRVDDRLVDLDGDGAPDAYGLDTDDNGTIDFFNAGLFNGTQPISTGGELNRPALGPSFKLGNEDIDAVYHSLIENGRDDIAYWLAYDGNVVLKQYDETGIYIRTTPPTVYPRYENGRLILDFRRSDRGTGSTDWIPKLIEYADSGDSTEYNTFYYNYIMQEPDPTRPRHDTLTAGDRIPEDSRVWLRRTLDSAPGLMANGAFQVAIEFVPVRGAGTVLRKVAEQGYTLAKLGNNFVFKKGAAVLGEAKLGQILSGVTGRLTAAEAAEWVGRFCFTPETLVHTEHGARPIGELEEGDWVWSYRFADGQWVLCRVAARVTSTYHGTLTRLRTADGTIEATGAHPVWVIRGEGLAARPRCSELRPHEDEGPMLDGRWVDAQNVRAGDVVYGRDGRQHMVLVSDSREGLSPVCSLSVDQCPNFAVGAGGLLVHNKPCFKTLIEQYTGRAVPQALLNQAAQVGYTVHGHHIVHKTVTKGANGLPDAKGLLIQAAQNLLNRNGLSVLPDQASIAAVAAATPKGQPVVLHNLCYAINHYQSIHTTTYCQKVLDLLEAAEKAPAATVAQRKANVRQALLDMATVMEAGGKFW